MHIDFKQFVNPCMDMDYMDYINKEMTEDNFKQLEIYTRFESVISDILDEVHIDTLNFMHEWSDIRNKKYAFFSINYNCYIIVDNFESIKDVYFIDNENNTSTYFDNVDIQLTSMQAYKLNILYNRQKAMYYQNDDFESLNNDDIELITLVNNIKDKNFDIIFNEIVKYRLKRYKNKKADIKYPYEKYNYDKKDILNMLKVIKENGYEKYPNFKKWIDFVFSC